MGVKKINVITGDWVSGRTFLGSFVRAFTKQGGQVVSEQYPPITATDFASYFTNFKDADAVVGWFPGASGATFLAQYNEFGIRKKMPLIAAFYGNFFERDVLKSLAPAVAEASLGEMTGTLYTSLIDSPGNKPFIEAFRAKFAREPGVSEAQAFTGAKVAIEALKATGGDTTPDKLRQAILAVDIQAPEGRIRFDKEKAIAIRNVYIVKIDKVNGEFTFVPVFTYENVPLEGF
jgi:branched-chain amino acid transport system substrate-binding protein